MDGSLVYLCGASRSGKTLTAEQETRDADRLLVWDPKGSWSRRRGMRRVTTALEYRAALIAAGQGRARIALVPDHPSKATFTDWAALTFEIIRALPNNGTTVVAEEIANVTDPGKGSRGWHRLITQALEFGPTIYAITQSPAEADKTTLRNASRVRTFLHVRDVDRRAIARELDVDPARIAALKPLEYLERDTRTHVVRAGKLTRPR